MAKKLSEETIQLVINLYNEGQSSEIIGKLIGSKAQTVTKYLKEAGIEIRGPKTKLQEGDKEKMCALYKEGLSAPKIAEQFGVQPTLVLRYLEQAGVDRRSAEEAHRKYPINEDFFDVIDTEEKAYFLGILYADGCNHKDANYVSLALEHSDKEILYKLAALIYKENPQFHVKFYDRTNGNKGITASLVINSKHICEQLEKLGCVPAKTFKLIYPEWMPENLHRHFIRGYFDGDGSLFIDLQRRAANMKITSTLQFVTEVGKIITNETSAHLTIYAILHSNAFNLVTSGNRQIRNILKWMYADSSIYLKRKFDKYNELLLLIDETDERILAGTQGYSKCNYKK